MIVWPGRLLLICYLVFGWCGSVKAQQWTRFHGPNGQGASESADIPVKWNETDYNWKTKLPGIGHSSPVLWGDKVFLLSADPETATRYVLCIGAASGKILWNREFPSTPHHLNPRSSFASCTPAVDAERVYIAWSTPDKVTFMALDHQGNTVWDLDLGRWQSQHGFGTSPVIYKEMVFLSNSQQAEQLNPGEKPGKSFMMAFDRKTGEEIWRTPRKSVNVCYTVPCIYQPKKGKPQLVAYSTGNGMFGLDPQTGKELWSLDAFTKRTVASPLIVNDIIYGSTGSGGGGNYVVAIRPGKTPEILYEIKTAANYVPSPVAYGNLVFLWYDRGIVTCIDSESGKVHWRKRIGGGFSGSPVRVRDKVYCISDDGVVVVLSASKQFKELGRNRLGEASRATPAVAGGRMYLRTYSHLISIGGKSL